MCTSRGTLGKRTSTRKRGAQKGNVPADEGGMVVVKYLRKRLPGGFTCENHRSEYGSMKIASGCSKYLADLANKISKT